MITHHIKRFVSRVASPLSPSLPISPLSGELNGSGSWRNPVVRGGAVLFLILVLASCSVDIPQNASQSDSLPHITPDYSSTVIPPNIAPLNFQILDEADAYVTRIFGEQGDDIIVEGKEVQIAVDKWHSLLNANRGGTLQVEVFLKRGDDWTQCQTLSMEVAEEGIDEWISYRLIEPSYVDYEQISINQRNLTNFDEQVIYSNQPLSDGDKGQCVNCHNYRNYNRSNEWQMHVRETFGGTVIVQNGKAQKVNLKTDSTRSAGVYPAWHPTENLIAYSVNSTGQVFHTRDPQKIEVIDFGSDLVLYDIDGNRVFTVSALADEYESFPAWSPDGSTLYYTSAHYVQKSDNIDAELDSAYESLKYNICKRRFNPKTMQFTEADTVFNARLIGKSASLPRISPDGKYLLFGLADYGNFHIWHKSSDLWVMNLETDSIYALKEANSEETESYHTWSSNGRWIIYSSRRDDGNYTRPYICYFDKNGTAHKPFVLPQKSTKFYQQLFKSFNVPEFMVQPVTISRRQLLKTVRGEAHPVSFAGSASDSFSSSSQLSIPEIKNQIRY